jgi:hypothetical protein
MEHIIYVVNAIPNNREYRRAVEREFVRNIKPFMEIERMFFESLNEDDEFLNYERIYQSYLHHWNIQLRQMEGHKCFDLTIPNKHYFERLYKPIESQKQSLLFTKQLNQIRSKFINQ